VDADQIRRLQFCRPSSSRVILRSLHPFFLVPNDFIPHTLSHILTPSSSFLPSHPPLFPPLLQDFQGQKLSEYLYYYLIILCGAAGWLYGYTQQSFLPTFYAWAVGLALSLIVCTPDWPFYNRHPVAWLKEFPRPSVGGGGDKRD